MEGTPMYAASLAKQVVAALAAQQVLAAQLDPDASITDLLPGLPARAGAIRVRHLIHHTSGLPTTARVLAAVGLPVNGERHLDNALVMHGLRRLRAPDRPPGKVFAYSNSGYVVLAELLCAVTGTSLPDLARARLFTPLGMSASRLSTTPDRTLPEETCPPRTLGDGGLWTTAGDMLTWLDGLNRDRAGVSSLMQTPGRLDDGRRLDYAWGITARPDPAGTSYTHGGNWPGWCAKTIRRPATGTAVALLTTSNDVEAVSQAAVDLHDRLTIP
jgi:CubicO group peptidase (beta-lactamase class C family)